MIRKNLVALGFILLNLWSLSAWSQQKPQYAGQTKDGFVLANGWRLTPVGEQIPLSDLPLNIGVTTDSRFALVATSGYNTHALTVVDLEKRKKADAEEVKQSWFGLAMDAAQQRVWLSAGGGEQLHAFQFESGQLTPTGAVDPKPEAADPKADAGERKHIAGFKTGLCVASDALYSLTIIPRGGDKAFVWSDATSDQGEGGAITLVDLASGQPRRSGPAGARPYDVVLARNGLLYVSDWARSQVLVIDAETLRTIDKIPVGEHPNQLVLHPQDDRLFVACASSNAVSVIDTRAGTVQETIITSLFPLAPEGSTPDALAIAPDAKTLYVANADNNCVAVVDIEQPKRSQVKGFIPTGWYPTSLAVTPNGKLLLVGVGKGNQTHDNKPADDALQQTPQTGGYKAIPFAHVGTTLSGALSLIPVPDDEQLAALTNQVYSNCPYSDKLLSDAPYERKTAIPNKVGDPSPIKYVIYIIKENRTYDQVLSDIPRGNRDPSLLMFGEEITPNHHKLANEFVLLDNLYCNGHVSADGHPWSTMAYNTDYIARNWALTYSGRSGIEDDEEGHLSNAPSGFIWDACRRNGLTYRSYGEYGMRVSQPDGSFRMEGRVPGLVGHFSPRYGLPKTPDHKVRDTDRVEVFLEEFREFEKNDNLPRFMVLSLGEDHTEGTRTGAPTPQACVASNDLALGQLVEGVSHSRYWGELAIFVIEDDAQNGPDHVDAHRTVGFVISPFVRRHQLDSTQYSTVSMLRTMELILGLAPLSQFDAAANPMFGCFSDQADMKPYDHVPARIDLAAVNLANAYGADRSLKMDFTEYDKIDDFELNEILWRAIKGVDAPLPPAVRRAIAYRGSARELGPAERK